MTRHSHDDLLRALGKGEIAPVYYLHGPEDVLKDEGAEKIIELALAPHERDFNLDQRSAGDLDPESLHALVNTLPMLAARRAVVIRDIEAWKKKPALRAVLLKYLENPAQETVLVLVQGAGEAEAAADIESRAWSVHEATLEPARVSRWIAHHAKSRELIFAEGAAEHLARATGYDLAVIRTELEKFAGLPAGELITIEQVGQLVGIRHGETLDDWVEAVLSDRTADALRLTPRVLEQAGLSGVKMVTALGTSLLGVRLSRALLDRGTRGPALERALFDRLRAIRPFGLGDWKVVTRNWSRWAEAWSGARLRAGIRAALAADGALKGTRLSGEDGVITDLVLVLGEGGTPRTGHAPVLREPATRTRARAGR